MRQKKTSLISEAPSIPPFYQQEPGASSELVLLPGSHMIFSEMLNWIWAQNNVIRGTTSTSYVEFIILTSHILLTYLIVVFFEKVQTSNEFFAIQYIDVFN